MTHETAGTLVALAVTPIVGAVVVSLTKGRTPLDIAISCMIQVRATLYLAKEMGDAAWRRRDRWQECLDLAWRTR